LLEKLRIELGLKKKEMAQKLGILPSYYSMVIRSREPVSKNVAFRAYEEFGAPLEKLLSNPMIGEQEAAPETNPTGTADQDPTGTEG
jgi:transcriptional regulator with XRE-family HTH domain